MGHCFPPLRGQDSAFFRLNRARRTATVSAVAAEGLQDVGQPRILFLLGEEDEDGALPSQQELAQRLRVSPATIANSLSSLERMGYVVRQSDLVDRRKKRIAITEKGRDARRRCIDVFKRVDEQLYAGFSPDELEQLEGFYLRMLHNMEAIGGRAEHCSRACPKGAAEREVTTP